MQHVACTAVPGTERVLSSGEVWEGPILQCEGEAPTGHKYRVRPTPCQENSMRLSVLETQSRPTLHAAHCVCVCVCGQEEMTTVNECLISKLCSILEGDCCRSKNYSAIGSVEGGGWTGVGRERF